VGMYKPYLSYDEYIGMGGNTLPSDNAEEYLKKASRHIDTLTYNRINKFGFESLNDFQKEIIKEVLFKLANFEYENEDILSSVLSGYSINGVSMDFNSKSWNVTMQNGVAIKTDDYELLSQTGLTTLSLRV
jgi:hypothetical protein